MIARNTKTRLQQAEILCLAGVLFTFSFSLIDKVMADGFRHGTYNCKPYIHVLASDKKLYDVLRDRETFSSPPKDFQFKLLDDRIEFIEKDSHVPNRDYKYPVFLVDGDGYVTVSGSASEGTTIDAFNFWHGRYQPMGHFIYTQTDAMWGTLIKAYCRRM